MPVDGYPESRVTINARPRVNVGRGRPQAANNAKALMQAIPEFSLVLSRHSVFPARITF